MSYPQPVLRPVRRGLPAGVILLLVVVALCLLGGAVAVGSMLLGGTKAPSAQPPAKVAVDQSELNRYWSDNFSATSWYSLTSAPSWDGNVLTARTKLHADGDARQPAMAICAALSNFWASSGRDFESVRVLDEADQILVSRHTAGDQCTWRR